MEVEQYSVNNLEIMYKDKLLPLSKKKAALGCTAFTHISNHWNKVDKWKNRNGTIITYY